MQSGKRYSPSTFQRTIDDILSEVRWQKCLCYVNDTFFFSSSMERLVKYLEKILSLLRAADVSLRLDRCHFFRSSIDYLGYVIDPGM
jgi:Reverse transcriptase (RNA-dependent DNA polymerase)